MAAASETREGQAKSDGKKMPVSYRVVASPESWSDEEQASLEATLREFPSSKYSIVTQCAKAAAKLPRKTIRDVGARLRTMPREEETDRRIENLLKANVDIIGKMRDNLHKIDLLDNIPLMGEFDRNVAATFSLLRQLDAQMPPFPVRVNTMYLAAGHASNASADAFDNIKGATSSPSSEQINVAMTDDHPPTIQIPPV